MSNYLLEEAYQLSQTNSQPGRLLKIREQLRFSSYPLRKNPLLPHQIPLTVRQCFAKAALLLTRYSQLRGKQTFGTLHSPTLSSYSCDSTPEIWQGEEGITRLCNDLGLHPNYTEKLNQLLLQKDEAIAKHQQIMATLLEEVEGIATKKAVLQLFKLLFGNLPLPEAAIDCLGTPMQLCFTINYQGGRLHNKGLWQSLTTRERVQLGRFLQQLDHFNCKQFACFPSFGKIQPQKINHELGDRLAKKIGCSKDQIISTIQSSVGICATEKAEAFFIHDIWGHFWQLFLTDFPSDYQFLSRCDEPSTSPSHHLINSLKTHLLAEILADINEFKWIAQHPQQADLLPSSSLFKHEPTKLDLICRDLGSLLPLILRQEYPDIMPQLLGELLELQNTLNQVYTQPAINHSFPHQDLLLLFAANYNPRDFCNLSEIISKYFYPCSFLVTETYPPNCLLACA
ncbi:MAG: hypothetical protein WA865_10340 [Spirulinaceae cyanobacterium]